MGQAISYCFSPPPAADIVELIKQYISHMASSPDIMFYTGIVVGLFCAMTIAVLMLKVIPCCLQRKMAWLPKHSIVLDGKDAATVAKSVYALTNDQRNVLDWGIPQKRANGEKELTPRSN